MDGEVPRMDKTVSLKELKAKAASIVKLEKKLRALPSFRDKAALLYKEYKSLLETIEKQYSMRNPEFLEDEFVPQLEELLRTRIRSMEERKEYNAIILEIEGKTELDLYILRRYLNHEDFSVRIDAAAAAELLEFREALPDLLERLDKEEHPFVLSKLTKVVGKLGDERVLETLIEYLHHENPRVRANTIEGIVALPGETKYQYILQVLEDEDNRVKANAITALKKFGPQKVCSMIKAMLHSPDDKTRRSVLYVLSQMHNDFAKRCLMEMTSDADCGIRCKAIRQLACYPDEDCRRLLLKIIVECDDDRLTEASTDSLRRMAARMPEASRDELLQKLREALATREEQDQKEEEIEIVLEDGDDETLIRELERLSAPNPARDTTRTRITGGEEAPSDAAEPTDDDAQGREGPDYAEIKARKVLARLSKKIDQLCSPQEKRKIQAMIRQGKIKNETQLMRVIQRTRAKKKR